MGTHTVQKSVSFAISLFVLVSVLTACGKQAPNTAASATQAAVAIDYCVYNGASYPLNSAINASCSCEQHDASGNPAVICLQ